MKILNSYKAWRCKRLARLGRFMVTLYWEAEYNPNDIIEIRGNFTNPPWTVSCKMTYNKFFKAYSTTVCMIVNSQFKYLVNGKYHTAKQYPIVRVLLLVLVG